jgi:aminoglycoside phosphotransferase (APT) family kinase protein
VETSARVGSGASRVTWLVSCSDGAERVLRVDSGDGPMAGTELTLAREAAVYAALGGGAVPIPRLLAVAPAGDALLVERAPGVDSLASLDPAGRAGVMDAYVDALVTLAEGPNLLQIEAFGLDGSGLRVERRVLRLGGEAAGDEALEGRALLDALRQRTAEMEAWAEVERRRLDQRRSLTIDAAPGQ